MDKNDTLLEGLLIRHSQLDKKDIIEGIRYCACLWLNMEGIPARVSDAIRALSSECGNELLRLELMELGYDGITEMSKIISCSRCVCSGAYQEHRSIVLWDADNRVAWPDDGYGEPEAGKRYAEIRFASGAFCIGDFGDDLAKRQPFFDRMWGEIASMNPDALDSVNHAAYFEIHRDEAVRAWNAIPAMLDRYETEYEESKREDRQARIAELERELARLKCENLN